MRIALPLFSFLFITLSWSSYAETFDYKDLRQKSYDYMVNKVSGYIKRSRNISKKARSDEDNQEAIEILRDGLKFVLSRPNQDNIIEENASTLEKELEKYKAFNDTLSSVVSEAIRKVQNEKAKPNPKTTSLFLLTNFMAEYQTEIDSDPEIKLIFKRIRDKKIEIPKDVKKEMRRSMLSLPAPSKTAEAILKKSK